MRLLLIEDEKNLADALTQILKKNHYTVDVFYDGESGEDAALSGIYDLILLDIMLPKKDGLSVLKTIREEEISTPILMLTAKSDLQDKVTGLDFGADDYIAKPFEVPELLARIRANLRRKESTVTSDDLSYGSLTLNMQSLLLSFESKHVPLTLKEAELLEYFMIQKNMVLSKEQLIEKIWGYDSEATNNHVEVYISFLRKKLTFLKSTITIQTVRGVGYTLKERDDLV
ncbi:MAG: response regulator transcription factor [Anaerorhabdus sp.]